jgi:hypothetical protein
VVAQPRNRVCACDADCWCNTTGIGRAIKWRVSARLLSRLGIHHKNSELDELKRLSGEDAFREWKRNRSAGMSSIVRHQPKYEKIVRFGKGRWGLTVRRPDGAPAVHEILGRPGRD